MNWFETTQLCDEVGQHIGGVFPPLLDGNVVTDVARVEAAMRPFVWRVACDPACADLAFVWMLPVGYPHLVKLAPEAVAVAVSAVDRGRLMIVHGETDAAAEQSAKLIALFTGGGHA